MPIAFPNDCKPVRASVSSATLSISRTPSASSSSRAEGGQSPPTGQEPIQQHLPDSPPSRAITIN